MFKLQARVEIKEGIDPNANLEKEDGVYVGMGDWA